MRFHDLEQWLVSTGKAEFQTLLRECQKFYAGDMNALPEAPDLRNFPRFPFPLTAIEMITTTDGTVWPVIALCQRI